MIPFPIAIIILLIWYAIKQDSSKKRIDKAKKDHDEFVKKYGDILDTIK